MQLLKRIRWAYLLLSLFLVGMGVCLLMWPEVSMNMACMIAGGGAVVFGLAKIIIYFVREIHAMVEQYDFAFGVLSIVGGAVLLIQPDELMQLIPQVLAICLMIDSVYKLQVALDAKRLGSGGWFLQLFAVLICVIWGVCLLIQPFGLDAYVSQLVAGGLIVDGVLNLLAVIFIAVTVKKAPVEGPAPNLPDPMETQTRASAPTPVVPEEPEEEDAPDVVESGLQVKDLIDQSRDQSNQPEGKGGIFSFFKK